MKSAISLSLVLSFYALYSDACNMTFMATDIITNLKSPGFNFHYPNNLNCWWNITTSSPDKLIGVAIVSFGLESSANCTYDSLTFYDGSNTSSPVLKRQCGTQAENVLSTGNKMFIDFKTDESQTGGGFFLTVLQVDRPHNITLIATDIPKDVKSPGYPFAYENNLSCWWNITTSSPEKVIGVYVVSFAVENSVGCIYDNLTIYDGWNKSSPVLEKMCGSRSYNVLSSGNTMLIDFKTDGSRSDSGFLLKIFQVDKVNDKGECGGDTIATSDAQYILTPGYPLTNHASTPCTWVIYSENENETIEIAENGVGSSHYGGCQNGFLVFYNGNSTENTDLLGVYCKNVPFTTLRSSNNIMTVVYHRNAITNYGFRLKYESVAATDCNMTIVASHIPTYIVSPGYPDAYYNDLTCSIQIESLELGVQLEILDFDVEESPECLNDSLTIYGGLTGNSELQRICGQGNQQIYTGHSLSLLFQTDSEGVGSGYRMRVTSTRTAPLITNCGNTSLIATSEPQYIHSPNYPNQYENYEDCVWKISATHPSMMVRIVVLFADIEDSSDGSCSYDYLNVYDGNDRTLNRIMSICGQMQPTVQSSGQSVTLRFHSDSSNVRRGFRLKYFETDGPYTCGGRINATSNNQWLTSPNWPGDYSNGQNCRWTVYAEPNRNIKLTMDVLDLEKSTTCRYDYVSIYDGTYEMTSNVGRACGNEGHNFVSSGSSMTIVFKSDGSNTGKGFRFRIQSGNFRVYNSGTKALTAGYLDGIITSPNYPFNYPKKAHVTWRIDTGDKDYVVNLNIETINTEGSYPCNEDYLEAFDGYSDSDTSLGRWCGVRSSISETSSGRFMFLKFKSDSTVSRPGFKLSYSKQFHFSNGYTSANVGPIIGGIIGGIAVIFIVIIVIGIINSKRRQGPVVRTVEQSNMFTITRYPEQPTTLSSFQMRPPSYSVATGGEGAACSPPPYSEVVSKTS